MKDNSAGPIRGSIRGSILVLGGSGQIGNALRQVFGNAVIAPSSREVDLARPESLMETLSGIRPALIINAAAYTAVDACEQEEARAHLINAESPGIMAHFAKQQGIPFIHYSTDYVFSGDGDKSWREDDVPAPVNAYGRTKLAGENAIREIGGNSIILRTSWVFGDVGKNFVRTMLTIGMNNDTATVVNDQHGSPSYASDIARATRDIITAAMKVSDFPSGIYHLCNSGTTSWYEFAQHIFREAAAHGLPLTIKNVTPVSTEQRPSPAQRPRNSRLDTHKIHNVFGIRLPTWQDALKRFFDQEKFS